MGSRDSATITKPDLSADCWTCDPLQQYVDLSQGFADKLGNTLHDPIFILFASLCGLWMVLSALKLNFQMTTKDEIIKDFVFISITGLLLGSQGAGLISQVYSGALDIMGGSAEAVFSIAGEAQRSTGHKGLVALAANGEIAVAKVIQAAMAIMQAGALYEIQNYIYALILVVPYFLLVVAYSGQVVVAIFRAAMVAVFAPFLFMAFAFGWGRDMAKAGAKTLLATILVLFASTAALALVIYGVNTIDLDPTLLKGKALNEFASISNPQFLVILFLGWMGTALMTEGISMANSIASTALTNSAVATMTAGAAGTALMLGKKGPGMAGNAAAGFSRAWQFGQSAIADPNGPAVQDLLNKFKNVNKPGSGS